MMKSWCAHFCTQNCACELRGALQQTRCAGRDGGFRSACNARAKCKSLPQEAVVAPNENLIVGSVLPISGNRWRSRQTDTRIFARRFSPAGIPPSARCSSPPASRTPFKFIK